MECLICPVCKNILEKEVSSYRCVNNHSFDISKNGYVNLLLNSHFRSSQPGDNREMVEARRNFHDKDIYNTLKNKLSTIIYNKIPQNGLFCDIACGEGYYTNYIYKKIFCKNATCIGIDISKFAILEASKKVKKDLGSGNLLYAVGNLNSLPIQNNCIDVILSCFAPMDASEFNRILKYKGLFIRVLPNKEHLFELKTLLYKDPRYNIEKEPFIYGLKLIEKLELKETKIVDRETLIDLFKMTPLYYKTNKSAFLKFEKIEQFAITLDFLIYVYEKE